MVTLLITALVIFAVIGIGLYFWSRPAPAPTEHILPPPDARSLFEDAANVAGKSESTELASGELAESLIAQAKRGERSVLKAAHASGEPRLYDRVLNELVSQAGSAPKLLALTSYVTTNELPVNANLGRAAIIEWTKTPNRSGASKTLHIAALSDDAEVYQEAVETALQYWREGKLKDLSAGELKTLLDGEFWILSSRSRSSGAGFVLKRTLASARRELEAATGATQ